MDHLKLFMQEQINVIAKRYENSISADEFIEFKKMADVFIVKRTQSIREFYKSSATEDRISFVLKHRNKLSMRLTFYKSGSVQVVIEYYDNIKKMTNDPTIMSHFALDVGQVYFIESEFGWKIGKTKNLKNRKDIFNVKLPFPFAVRYHIRTHEKTKLEKQLHEYFKDKNINGEWFLITRLDIVNYIGQFPMLKLSRYSPDDTIYIDRKYLTLINS